MQAEQTPFLSTTMGADCIPSNPDISGIGVRTAIYAQNLLCFAPVIAHLWDGKISVDELKGIQDQSIGMLAVAFAILISTIIEARAKGGPMITSFHAAVILDLSWMNNTSMFIWLLLYAHHRSKADNLSAIPATWNGWLKALVSPLRHLAGIKNKMDSDALGRNGRVFKRLQGLLLQAPVLTIGSMHLSLMAAIGIWLWSDPAAFGTPISCDPSLSTVSLSIVGRAVRFSSPALRICSLLIYSLVLIPGINLVVPFLIFITLHILHNKSRRRHPGFWSGVEHPLRAIRSRISGTRMSDAESQNNSWLAGRGLPSPVLETRTGFLLVGLGCLAVINIIFVIDVELALARNKNPESQEDDEWGFGQVLALLLLVVPIRDFVSSIIEIRRKLLEHDNFEEERTHRFEDVLQNAIDTNHIDVAKFKALIESGASPDTPIQDHKFVTLFQLAAYLGEVDMVRFLADRVDINIAGETFQ
ncbi:hypothetical protein DFH08DRAFT_350376 [Mycena albidolilacea]|uniref:Uncharacterized protein n=1 Tax=Mycena albidolilacea TaxID=1033008 RepID=A0AAD6ZI62_9AGAR|nr:hypothetical protein DFH08DRAFT_350376 [Mycena albidolilacea]